MSNIYPNKSLSIRFTISNSTGVEYQEVQTTSTDAYGMINLVIGQGSALSGSFTEVNWDGAQKELRVELNLGGGYTLLSTQSLLFVPYALHRDVTATGNLEVAGDVGFTGDLEVEGETNLNSSLTVNNSSATQLTGTLEVDGVSTLESSLTVNNQSPTLLTGTLAVDGASKLNSTLAVDGVTTLNNSLTVTEQSSTVLTGTLTVDGVSNFNNALNVNNQSPAYFSGNIEVDGIQILNGDLTVNGATNLNSSLSVNNQSPTLLTGILTADGSTTLNNTLDVTGGSATNLTGTLNIDGATTLNNTLDVTGGSATNLTGTLNVDGTTGLNSSLRVNNQSPTLLTGTLTVDGATTLNNTLDVTNGSATNLTGTLNVDGATDINNTLTVDGATTLNNTLDVTNGSATNLTGTLNVDGATDINNTLTVDGATTLNNTLDVTNGSATNLTGTLNVDGATDINNTLTVDGATTLNNTLDVTNGKATNLTGTLNVDGATDINNTLTVDGVTKVNNTLTVSGVTTINNDLTVTGTATIGDISTESLTIESSKASYVATFENTNGTNGDGLLIKLGRTHGAWNGGSYLNIQNPSIAAFNGPLNTVKGWLNGGTFTPIQLFDLVPATFIAGAMAQIANSIIGSINSGLGLPIGMPEIFIPETTLVNRIVWLNSFTPCIPRVCIPEVCVPEVCLLGVCTPAFCTPEVCTPELCGPTIPEIATPAIVFPRVTLVPAIPNLLPAIPTIPTSGLPSLEIPNFTFSVVSNSLTKENEYITFQDKDGRRTGTIRAQSTTDFRDRTVLDNVYLLNVMSSFVGIDLLEGIASGTAAITNLVDAFNKIGVEYSSGNGDYAEWLERVDVNEYLSAGDIVAVKGGKVTRDLNNVEQIMVVSHKPIVLGNAPEEGKKYKGNNIAFMGQVPVKVIGAVQTGDYIVASSEIKGYGVAIHPENMTAADFTLAVGRSWENNATAGPKMVNTVVGVKNGDFKIQVEKIQDAQDKLDTKIESLENRLQQIKGKIKIAKANEINYVSRN